MAKADFYKLLGEEVLRIDDIKTSKRNERIITSYISSTTAVIDGKKVVMFNSNDYLGLRHNTEVKKADHEAAKVFGTGPGAVRFISGTTKVHKDLEKKIAEFHGRDDAMVFSSAFAANLAVMFALSSPQAKDSKVSSDVFVVSDALNHRSIIDGIRLPNLPSEQRSVFNHMDMDSLEEVLKMGIEKYQRAIVVTDGVFSMLGEIQNLKKMREVVDKYDVEYPQGVLLVVDDCHGIAAIGTEGRGTEEICGVKADVLVGTLGKGFGCDGGYVTSNKDIINYLRESAATYIYSNSITPGTAGAALSAFNIVSSKEGKSLLEKLKANTEYFKNELTAAGYSFAADSVHPIQPVLIGEPMKNRQLAEFLFEKGILVTPLSYPVVQQGRDEIRVQISAAHETNEIDLIVSAMKEFAK